MADVADSPGRREPEVLTVPPSEVRNWVEYKNALKFIGEKVIYLPWPWGSSGDDAQSAGRAKCHTVAAEEIEVLRAEYESVKALFTAASDRPDEESAISEAGDDAESPSESPGNAVAASDGFSDSPLAGAAAGTADPSAGDTSSADSGTSDEDGDKGMEATGRALHEALARVCRTRRLNGGTERDCEMLVSTVMEHVVDAMNQATPASSIAMAHNSRLDFEGSKHGFPTLVILKKRDDSGVYVPRVVVQVKRISASFFTPFTHTGITAEARRHDIQESESQLKTSLGQLCRYMYRGNICDGVLTNGASYFLVVRRMVEGGPPVWIVFGPRTITELLDVDRTSHCLAVTTTYEAVREDLNGCVLELAAFSYRALGETVVKSLDEDMR